MEKLLSERVSRFDSSGIRKVFALASSMENPINFSIGQPDFDVPEAIKAAAIDAINSGQNRYSQTAGDSCLLEKLRQKVINEYGWEKPQVLVTSGVSGALLLTFLTLINPGDEVIMADPYFVIYKHVVNMVGGKCVFINSYPDFKLPVSGIEEAITDRTKLIILNSPANPTGSVYTEDQVKAIARVAAQKDILLMTDEIYEEFCYDRECVSVGRYYDKVLVLKGFSKSYAMTGWRMGYVARPEIIGPIIEQMTKIQQYTFVCAPAPFQKAAMAALDHDMSEHVAKYKQKRDLVYNGLKDKFEVVKPGGAFYTFIKSPPWAASATEFVKKAIENNVLVIPGSVFSEQDTHFRISYATTNEKIKQGVEILAGLTEA
jgi:aspartate aminotransferase/aminotransferase